MASTDVPSTRASRLSLLEWIGFGLGISFLALLVVSRARGANVSWIIWALALLNVVNMAGGLPGVPSRARLALTVASLGLCLATLAALVSGLYR